MVTCKSLVIVERNIEVIDGNIIQLENRVHTGIIVALVDALQIKTQLHADLLCESSLNFPLKVQRQNPTSPPYYTRKTNDVSNVIKWNAGCMQIEREMCIYVAQLYLLNG